MQFKVILFFILLMSVSTIARPAISLSDNRLSVASCAAVYRACLHSCGGIHRCVHNSPMIWLVFLALIFQKSILDNTSYSWEQQLECEEDCGAWDCMVCGDRLC